MGYDLDFKYIKFKDLLIAYALSRSHTTNHTHSQIEEEIEKLFTAMSERIVDDEDLEKGKEAQAF